MTTLNSARPLNSGTRVRVATTRNVGFAPTIQSLRVAYRRLGPSSQNRLTATSAHPARNAGVQRNIQRAMTAPPIVRPSTPKATKPPSVPNGYGYNGVQQYSTSSIKPPERFSFIWALKNFKEIRQLTEFLSQQFYDDSTQAIWKLKLLPKRKESSDFLGIKLICHSVGELDDRKLTTSFEIAILDCNDNPFQCSVKHVENHIFEARDIWTLFQFVRFDDLDSRRSRLLDNDTLRIQCTMWRKRGTVSHSSVRPCAGRTTPQRELQFFRTLATDFSHLLTSSTLCDLELVTPTKSYMVHKCVLAARSKVFAAMLSTPMTENLTNVLQIFDCEDVAVGGLLEFIYTGDVTDMAGQGLQLLQIAEKYDLPELKYLAEEHLLANVTMDNVCDLLAYAHLYDTPKLMKSVHKFISVRSDEIVKSATFEKFVKIHPHLAVEVFRKR